MSEILNLVKKMVKVHNYLIKIYMRCCMDAILIFSTGVLTYNNKDTYVGNFKSGKEEG